jgi:hypothetical protein
MSGIEYGFCSVAEYEAGRQNRTREDALNEDEFYTAMFALGAVMTTPRAAKFASRVNRVEQLDSGLYKVNFTILNVEPPSEEEADSRFRDAYWQKDGSDNITFTRLPVTEGYFRPFDMDADAALKEWTAQDVEKQLEASLLQPALAA